jgi:hypothetical protein
MPPEGPTLRERTLRTLVLMLLLGVKVSRGSPRTNATKGKLTAKNMLANTNFRK